MTAGDKPKMREALTKRNRSSLCGLIRLLAVPKLETTPGELAHLKAQRNEAFEGESALIWAIQEGDDTSTRQRVPEWVCKPIETFVMNFSDEKGRFDALQKDRAAQGKPLTANQRLKLENFHAHSCQRKFLFDKVKMQVVTKMRTNADLRTVSEKMFSLQVSITGDDLDIMLVKVGNGDQHRLVLLRGHPVQGDGPIPSCFNAGISSEVKEALKNGEGLEDTSHIEHSDEEMDPDALEQQALVEAEEGLDRMEICMDSSDEEVIKSYVPAGGYVRVKTWKDRPAFQKLSEKGLTMIPTHREGVFLSHHTERCTWQGHYPNCDKQMNFKYGGLKGRTLFRMEACFDRNPHSKFFHFAAYLVGLCIYVLFTCLHIHIHIYIYTYTHTHTTNYALYIYIKYIQHVHPDLM